MPFDADNKIFQLCAKGMEEEVIGNIESAITLYNEAWQAAQNDFEALTASHYLARNRENPAEELKWNLQSLANANNTEGDEIKSYFPSLHLNTGKSYEKIGDWKKATQHYKIAESFIACLPADGYGKMIQSGIAAALERSKENNSDTKQTV